jgi:hypothetical protein
MKTTNTRVQSRTEEQRELNTREEEWTFEEPNALDIPKTVEKKFDAEGMRLRWIRVSMRGNDDIANVGKREAEGWTFVLPSEVPEMSSTSFVREDGRYNGTVSRGDLALAKMPVGRAVARQKFYEKKSSDMVDAVNAQLMKGNNSSRMPISNNSKSTIIKGRHPNFQD